MLVHHHRAACQTRSPAHRFDLQAEVLKVDRVVPVHRTLELQGEDEIQIAAATGHKRAAPFCGLHLEAAVKLGHVVLPQKRIGCLQRLDSEQPQFLRQSSLPGPEIVLAATPRLWRVGRYHLNPKLAQGASHLRQTVRIDPSAHLWVSQK
jgi:hypothetical protein